MSLRVVTLPPNLRDVEAIAFAEAVKKRGADILEVRNDLHEKWPLTGEAPLPLLVSERGKPLEAAWKARATYIDIDLVDAPMTSSRSDTTEASLDSSKTILSRHTKEPLTTADALSFWRPFQERRALAIKHVEPLGSLDSAARLFETQAALQAMFPETKVTVLAMGPLASPFRAVLAEKNAFDYVAEGSAYQAAPGQRLLDDAVRSARKTESSAESRTTSRLAILGHRIEHSASPRLHPPPFDRIDVPEDADLGALLRALQPHYLGFAVTSPFKIASAKAVGASLPSINTLVRMGDGYRATNTDVDGARAILRRLSSKHVTILGNGGVTPAIVEACASLGISFTVLTRADAKDAALEGDILWTWPPHVDPPSGLRLDGARVAVIAYGPPGKHISERVTHLGGTPIALGIRWLIAQARAQRTFWGIA